QIPCGNDNKNESDTAPTAAVFYIARSICSGAVHGHFHGLRLVSARSGAECGVLHVGAVK
ncbi:MAG: hypothetical protein WCA48_21700, partial [Pseudomonas gingeri]